MPSACPFATSGVPKPNKGYPEDQRPLVSLNEAAEIELETLKWEEVVKHDKADDLWLVWHGHVYDVSSFAKVHPGGLKVLLGGVGREMSKAFDKAKHSELTKVFALNFRIGKIEPGDPPRRTARGSDDATREPTAAFS
jgi:cytochrome b involved in lipid metabolism